MFPVFRHRPPALSAPAGRCRFGAGAPAKICLAFAAASLISGCSEPRERPAEIVVGVIAPLERIGPAADGAILAANEINAAGGIDVGGRRRALRLIVEDSEGRPEAAVSKALELIGRDRAVALLGVPRSDNAIPVAKIAEQRQIPLISTLSSHPETTEGKRYVFRLTFLNAFQGQVMAEFAFRDLGARTAAVLIDAADAYSTSLADEFSQVFQGHGGKIVAFETFTEDDTDVSPQLLAVLQSDPDVFFLPYYSRMASLHAGEARRLGVEAILLGGDTWNYIPRADVSHLAGAYFTDVWAPDRPDEETAAFVARYREAFSAEPTSAAAISYDAVRILAETIRLQGRADPESIRAGLAAPGAFRGVSGDIEFAGSGDPVRSAFIRRIEADGQTSLQKEIRP